MIYYLLVLKSHVKPRANFYWQFAVFIAYDFNFSELLLITSNFNPSQWIRFSLTWVIPSVIERFRENTLNIFPVLLEPYPYFTKSMYRLMDEHHKWSRCLMQLCWQHVAQLFRIVKFKTCLTVKILSVGLLVTGYLFHFEHVLFRYFFFIILSHFVFHCRQKMDKKNHSG